MVINKQNAGCSHLFGPLGMCNKCSVDVNCQFDQYHQNSLEPFSMQMHLDFSFT